MSLVSVVNQLFGGFVQLLGPSGGLVW
jgi:hypothetical protein